MGNEFLIDPNVVEVGIKSDYVPEDTPIDLVYLTECPSEFLVNYEWQKILIATALLVVGMFLTLSGYRAFRFTMWLSGSDR